jgi:nitrogen-specific signal transduction histidine kinase
MRNEYLHQNGQLALEVLPEAIILVDNNHVIQFMNLAAVRLFKISDVATFLGTSFSTFPGGSGLMTYPQRVAYNNHINEFATHKVPSPQPDDEQRWSTDINNRFFNFRATPMRDEQNQDCGFVICVNEWSGERKASELLSSLISELLTPFHAIRGYSELLLKENPSHLLTKKQRELMTHINENAKKLLELRETIIVDYKKQNEDNK